MRCRLIASLLLLGGIVSSLGQGTLNFANGGAGVNAPVRASTTQAPLAGAEWRAHLLWIRPDGAREVVFGNAPFVDGEVALGYFFAGIVELKNALPGERVTVIVRVTSLSGAAEGESNPVTVTLGGGLLPPANLVGLEPWAVAPTTRPILTISLVRDRLRLSWSASLVGVTLESTPDLGRSQWTELSLMTTNLNGESSVSTAPDLAQRYYRLRLPQP